MSTLLTSSAASDVYKRQVEPVSPVAEPVVPAAQASPEQAPVEPAHEPTVVIPSQQAATCLLYTSPSPRDCRKKKNNRTALPCICLWI
ncbi:hypothetical protein AERO_18705 [Aeromicrobium fastidiosum]|uniref:hypothetical protein n=1 Tax=Aeromicrobium fastidiosum TaxID=52699 RepID=UPI0020231947|nr:hypothetical protein [Aeromicrobium fastidiosum]MCL8253415.1 hypothetical protein [Aeromicrobium fastidiosum]